MQKNINLLCVMLSFTASVVSAACPDPTEWMEVKNQHVIEAIKGVGTDAGKANVIQSVFQPSLDIDFFTKKIVGRSYWLEASNTDREALKKNIYDVMLNDYTQAVVETLAKKPKVYRVRDDDGDKATVTVLYHTQKGKNLLAMFAVVCDHDVWKIQDIAVAGVRLSDLQQAKYSKILNTSGVKGLNAFLKESAQTESRH